MIVVSDSSPLTSLAAIGQLGLLERLYSRVLIPSAVAEELRFGEKLKAHPPFLAITPWIEVHEVLDHFAVEELLGRLDLGEAEAIVLAREQGAGLLLMDEKPGRKVAAENHLETIGVLGILLSAKERGLIPAIKPLLDTLIDPVGFWVTPALYRSVLQECREL